MRVWKAFDGPAAAVAFGPDGGRLAVGSPTWGVKLFDVPTGQERWHLDEPRHAPRVAFTADGSKVVALAGGRVLVLDAADGRPLARHSRRIAGFAAPPEPDELLVVTAGMDVAEFRRLNLLSGDVMWRKVLQYHGGIGRMELSPDGRTVGTVGAWEALLIDVEERTIQFTHRMKADSRRPAALAFSPDGGTFAFAERGTLRTCRVDSLDPSAAVETDGPPFHDLAFRGDGRALFAVRGAAAVEVWDAGEWKLANALDWKVGRLGCVAVSPDGAVAAAGSETGKVVVWDVDL